MLQVFRVQGASHCNPHLRSGTNPAGVVSVEPEAYQDFSRHLDFSDWMSCHKFALNERFVVSLGTWREDPQQGRGTNTGQDSKTVNLTNQVDKVG